MSGSFINSDLETGIVAGTGNYPLPLVITAQGTVAPTLSGADGVVMGAANGFVTNDGLISGAYGSGGGGGTGANGGIGLLDQQGGINLTNTGTITGGDGGNNNGNDEFAGNGADGVFLTTGDVLTNTGLIAAGNGANGEIGGNGGVGVYLAGNGTLITYGVIDGGRGGRGVGTFGTYGDAVQFGAAGTLVLEPGASFFGAVQGNAQDVLALAGASAAPVAGIGTEYLNFSQISFAAGAQRIISGDAAGLANGQTVSGMAVGDEIILTGLTVTSDTYVSGVGLKVSDGTTTDTLNIAGVSASYDFLVTGGNAGTTIALSPPIYTISSAVTSSVTLDNAQSAPYASPLTVSSTGLVQPSGFAFAAGVDIANVPGTATLVNDGSIIGQYGSSNYLVYGTETGGVGVNAAQAAYILNSGVIDGGSAAQGFADGEFGYVGGTGVDLVTGATLVNTGNVTGGHGGFGQFGGGNGGAGMYVDGGVITNAGEISGGAGGIAYEGGTAAEGDAVTFGPTAGTLVVEQGAAFNGLVVANSGVADVLELAGPSSVLAGVGTEFQDFDDISFAAGASGTIEGDAAGLAGPTITGFVLGDTIDLTGVAASSYSYVTGTGLVLAEGLSHTVINITGDDFVTGDFDVNSASGTISISLDQDVPCFCPGTRITTVNGEVAVEDLAIGDVLPTLHGGARRVKWIGTRSYVAPFTQNPKVRPVRIKAGAISDGVPARDMLVSPGHALCIDNRLIHAALLVNGVSITQAEAVARVTYYHVELESHEVIFAEGCPAETFRDEAFRGLFQNAVEFSRLYPAHMVSQPACLPQLTQGFALAAIQRRLAARAGILPVSARGALRGHVDQAGPAVCSGWAQDAAAPEVPVCLDILVDGQRAGRVLANRFREDVRDAGYGSGHHGFEFALPEGCTGVIDIRRAADGAALHFAVPARAALAA